MISIAGFSLTAWLIIRGKNASWSISFLDASVSAAGLTGMTWYLTMGYPPLFLPWEGLVFLLAYFSVRQMDECMHRRLLIGIVFCGVVQSLLGIFQQAAILDSNHPYFTVTGTFPNPGPFGGYLAVCFICSLFFCFDPFASATGCSFFRC
ncbi:MAG: hypothetical protein LUD68_08910 [Rikenellaceae bacterium]|nr:hypothetical protein [Rikenellaceae bacterium]